MTERSGGGRGRRKKFLTVEQKYELWTALVRGDATQRQLADRWGVDRTTVAKVAKYGALWALEASKPGRARSTRSSRSCVRHVRRSRG